MQNKTFILSTAYAPPLAYMNLLLNNNCIISTDERFVKQTYRNRCTILGANGLQDLSIPLKNRKNHSVTAALEIDYSQNWQKLHWKALEAAYKNSPYYDYFYFELQEFYENNFVLLSDFNYQLLCRLLKIARFKKLISQTNAIFDFDENRIDSRNSITPKQEADYTAKKYTQVFNDKFEFKSNLSFFDVLFNTGPDCVKYI
ncbi:MAG: WbqC family protein [Bacteroidota bacterium]